VPRPVVDSWPFGANESSLDTGRLERSRRRRGETRGSCTHGSVNPASSFSRVDGDERQGLDGVVDQLEVVEVVVDPLKMNCCQALKKPGAELQLSWNPKPEYQKPEES